MLSIYRASAGSGKTYTLAYEYIKLLIGYRDPENGTTSLYKGGNRHRSILAITFTNKATDEMKRRILHELAVLAHMEPGWRKKSPYMADLTKYYHTSEEEIAQASREALLHLLFDFNYFHVSTIDAFFQMILRTFAREAELTGNYELELDSKRAIKTGVDEMLNSLNRDSDTPESRKVVKWISDYLLREMDEGHFSNLFDRSNNFYRNFIEFIDKISDETFALNYREIMDYLSDPGHLTRFQTWLYEEIERRRTHALTMCESALKAQEMSTVNISYNCYLFPALSKWYAARGTQATLSKATLTNIAEDIEVAYSTQGRIQRAKGDYDAALEPLISEACKAVIDFDTNGKILSETAKNLFVLGLLEKVYRCIAEYRSENNMLLLSDTNSLLYNIIGDDDTPFVYERVGVWFHNFLIDEFQDTSKLQWENLYPLLSQGLANGHESLIIGDEKQCIYRFRDSDPTLLGSTVGEELKPYLNKETDDPSKKDTNWRSSADVVRFNNDLFYRIAELTGYGNIYNNVTQNIAPKRMNHRGYVKVQCVTVTSKEKEEKEDKAERTLEILCDDIDRQLAAGYNPGDIAILTRWRNEATKCIDYIERRIKTGKGFSRRFRIISDDAMLLESSPAVRLVMSILKFTEDSALRSASAASAQPRDCRFKPKGATATLINRYEFLSSTGIDPSEALEMALRENEEDLRKEEKVTAEAESMKEAEDADGGNSESSRSLQLMPSLKGHASLSSLVDEIIAMYLSDDARSEENMYLSAFQDIVLDYTQRDGNDLHGFVAWWDDNRHKLTVSAPEDNEAIRVMTIHKSKGLEFKCVHIPFGDWNLTSSKGYEWFVPSGLDGYANLSPEDVPPRLPFKLKGMEGTAYEEQYKRIRTEQRLDEINVMYVAFTRAVDELCVTIRRRASKKKKTPNSALPPKNTGDLLEILAPGNTPVEDGWIYEVGAPTTPREDEKSDPTALDPRDKKNMASYRADPHRDLWKNTRLDSLPDLKEGTPRERGIVLHDIMSRVHHRDDLHGVIMRLVRQGRVASSEAEEIEAYLAEAMARVADMGWFDGMRRVMCERDIVANIGNKLTHRPDRVVWTAGGTTDVIDYKFGEEHPEIYSRQVKRYMSLLRRLGEENVRGFIWYIDRNSIVEVK